MLPKCPPGEPPGRPLGPPPPSPAGSLALGQAARLREGLAKAGLKSVRKATAPSLAIVVAIELALCDNVSQPALDAPGVYALGIEPAKGYLRALVRCGAFGGRSPFGPFPVLRRG